MRAYMASLDRLTAASPARLYPGHGAVVPDAAGRVAFLTAHRKSRETAIRASLANGKADASTLAKAVYTDTPTELLGAAARNIFAHLIDLTERNIVMPIGSLSFQSAFRLR
jgi:glyoxylase-like metal-dependent hydrolase (beta-lactamase superfamily II)